MALDYDHLMATKVVDLPLSYDDSEAILYALSIGMGRDPLDLKELPRFQAPEYKFKEAVAPTVVDMGLLALYSLLAFAGAFVAFLRYDVR